MFDGPSCDAHLRARTAWILLNVVKPTWMPVLSSLASEVSEDSAKY